MAAKRRRRRSSGRRRSTSRRRRNVAAYAANPRRRRRSYRRNPGVRTLFSPKNIVGQVVQGATDAGLALTGKAAVRIVRSRVGQEGGTIQGTLIEAGTGIVGAFLMRRLSPNAAKMFLAGAFMAPVESLIKAANIPFVSSALGDDGTIPYVSGYDLPPELAGYSLPGEMPGLGEVSPSEMYVQ